MKALVVATFTYVLSISVWMLVESTSDPSSTNTKTPGRCEKCFSGIEGKGRVILDNFGYLCIPIGFLGGLSMKNKSKKSLKIEARSNLDLSAAEVVVQE